MPSSATPRRSARVVQDPGVKASGTPEAFPAKLSPMTAQLAQIEIDGHAVRLTHLQRVYWPAVPGLDQAPITKLDLIRYLVRMSPRMLPHLRDRPLTIFRWPGGISGRRVLQKHPGSALPAFVETTTIFSESKSADDEYLLCNNLATLVWLAEMGCLELHVWHSRVRGDAGAGARSPSSGSARNLAGSAVNFPDYMLFDLDPYLYSGSEREGGEPEPNEAGFARGRQVALRLKEVLDGMALASHPKTSGKTGLHVVVPITPTLRYDVVRRMAKAICEHLLARHAGDVTTEWSTGKRTGKVFLDFNMNVRGKSIIAPYCPRGLPAAPVSMPLTWRQLERAEPMQFRIPTVAARAARKDPWAAVLEDKQSLEAKLAQAIG